MDGGHGRRVDAARLVGVVGGCRGHLGVGELMLSPHVQHIPSPAFSVSAFIHLGAHRMCV